MLGKLGVGGFVDKQKQATTKNAYMRSIFLISE